MPPTTPTDAPTPHLTTDPELLARLRADLAASGFTVERLQGADAWGSHAGAALFRGERVAARRALARISARDASLRPAATLALLFVLGYPQADDVVAEALPTLGVDGAVAVGLVAREGDAVRALVDLRPYAFVDDLGADSLDTVELVMALEEEFECEIPDEEAEKITSVQQAIDYVKSHVKS